MARPLKPLVKSGGYYPSKRWTPLVYPGGYTTANGGGQPEPEAVLKTVTGSLIHITDALALPAEALSVNVEPIQDLHGYDHPWPAGGGVNLLDADYTETITHLKTFEFASPLPAGQYTFSFISANTSSQVVSYQLGRYRDETGSYVYTAVSPAQGFATFTNTEPCSKIILYSNKAYNESTGFTTIFTGLMIKAGGTGTYAPYSNICPISGRTSATVMRTGVNVWDEETRRGYYSSATGAFANDGSATMANNTPISVFPATTYYLKSATYSVVLFCYDKNMNFISPISGKTNSVFTTPANCYYINFCNTYDSGTTYNNDISINYPSTDTDYHAYAGNTYTIQLGDTVYGGTLDVVAGKMVVDRAYALLDDESKWVISDSSTAPYVYNQYFSNRKKYANSYEGLMCSVMPVNSSNQTYTARWTGATSNTFGIRATNPEISIDVFKGLSSRGELSICYTLATPIEITLTPTQIEMLLGENNLWSDAGDSTLTYYADGNASEIEALNILLGNRYYNNHEADEPTDREALDILLGNTR